MKTLSLFLIIIVLCSTQKPFLCVEAMNRVETKDKTYKGSIKYSPQYSYSVTFIGNNNHKLEYAFNIWAFNYKPYEACYMFFCNFRFDGRYVVDVRFSNSERMIVVDFNDGSSIDFDPDFIITDDTGCIDIEKSKENGFFNEITPKDVNPSNPDNFFEIKYSTNSPS